MLVDNLWRTITRTANTKYQVSYLRFDIIWIFNIFSIFPICRLSDMDSYFRWKAQTTYDHKLQQSNFYIEDNISKLTCYNSHKSILKSKILKTIMKYWNIWGIDIHLRLASLSWRLWALVNLFGIDSSNFARRKDIPVCVHASGISLSTINQDTIRRVRPKNKCVEMG